MAWSVSKLSESQTDVTTFALDFINVPDSLILNKASMTGIDLRIRASGFQFLGLQFNRRRLTIDLRDIRQGESGYYLPRQSFLSQIERQMPGTMNLLEINEDTLYIDFLSLNSKKVPVVADVSLSLGKNHLIEGEMVVSPESVIVRGPKMVIDTLDRVYTLPMVLNNQTEDFDVEVGLKIPEISSNVAFSNATVRISGNVFRFSEKIFEVPVVVLNLPEETEIKMFPSAIQILCKARIEHLKDLSPSDFHLVADFQSVVRGQSTLYVRLVEKPSTVHSARLLQDQVEFILKRE